MRHAKEGTDLALELVMSTQVPAPQRRVLLVVNPASSRASRGTDAALAVLERANLEINRHPSPDGAGALAALIRTHADEVDCVVLGGGDGTLNCALPALLETGLPLGVLPLGTANDFAASLGLPSAIEEAAAVIVGGELRAVDVGVVNERPYLNVASIGLVTEINRAITPERKQRYGAFAYAITAFESWQRMRSFRVELQDADGTIRSLRTRQVSVANGPCQGGRVVFPDNTLSDGLLDLYSLRADTIWRALKGLAALRLGTAHASPHVTIGRGPRFGLTTRRSMAIFADGEEIAHTPARFEVRPCGLNVYVPRAAIV